MTTLILTMQELLVDNWDMKWMKDNVNYANKTAYNN